MAAACGSISGRTAALNGFCVTPSSPGVIKWALGLCPSLTKDGADWTRPHGFRSSFRDWCAEATNIPRDVAEKALGHLSGGSVERAYRRMDFLEQMRAHMERWASRLQDFRERNVVRL